MPKISVLFVGEVSQEALEEIDSADPALLYEYLPELLEQCDNIRKVNIRELYS